MRPINFLMLLIIPAFILFSCGESKKSEGGKENKDSLTTTEIHEEEITYQSDSLTHNGFIVYDKNKKGRLPVIIIVHEWWGLNEYVKNRARQLAGLGYFAFAVDMYGEGKTAANPEEAQALATPFYQNPQMANRRINAAIDKLTDYKNINPVEMVAIGYCFGGSMVLNAAKAGMPFRGVVSFHGGLAGIKPEKNMIADILVCHGEADKFVPEKDIVKFKQELDSVGAEYTFKTYPDATHAFTNPDATENGKKFNLPIAYNEKADKDSWNDFMEFLKKLKIQ